MKNSIITVLAFASFAAFADNITVPAGTEYVVTNTAFGSGAGTTAGDELYLDGDIVFTGAEGKQPYDCFNSYSGMRINPRGGLMKFQNSVTALNNNLWLYGNTNPVKLEIANANVVFNEYLNLGNAKPWEFSIKLSPTDAWDWTLDGHTGCPVLIRDGMASLAHKLTVDVENMSAGEYLLVNTGVSTLEAVANLKDNASATNVTEGLNAYFYYKSVPAEPLAINCLTLLLTSSKLQAADEFLAIASGNWTDQSIWDVGPGGTYPKSSGDKVFVTNGTSAIAFDLQGGAYDIDKVVVDNPAGVTFRNGTLTFAGGQDHGLQKTASGDVAFENLTLGNSDDELFTGASGSKYVFTGTNTVNAFRIWFSKTAIGTCHNHIVVKDGKTTFNNGYFSNDVGGSTINVEVDNGVFLATENYNTLTFPWNFNVKLGENNTPDTEAAISFTGSISSTVGTHTLAIDATGKGNGVYKIFRLVNDASSKFLSNFKSNASVMVDAGKYSSLAVVDNTIQLTISDTEPGYPDMFYSKGGSGDWNATAMWQVDEGGLGYPSIEGDKVYFDTDNTISAVDLNLQGNTYAIDVIENTAANPVVIENGTLTMTTGTAGIKNAGELWFKNMTVNVKTDSDGCVENTVKNAVMGFEGNCTLNCCRFRGQSTQDLSIFKAKDGTTTINAQFIQRNSAHYEFDVENATLTLNGSVQVSFLVANITWNLTLGDNNTVDSQAMFKVGTAPTFTIQTAPKLTVDATAKGAGTYKLITIPKDNDNVSGLASTATVTCAAGLTGTVSYDSSTHTLLLTIE